MAEHILVTVVAVSGSAPRGAGAQMRVTRDGITGTIGGGALEWAAMARAREMLATGEMSAKETIALGPQIGQCCGGRVDLGFEADGEHVAETLPAVLIFGGGHVGSALARATASLPVDVTLYDDRAGYPPDLPGVQSESNALPEAAINAAADGSAVVITTHDHGLDLLLTEAALRHGGLGYVGLIGSATKRATFERRMRESDPTFDTAQLTCPIGKAGLGDKRPEVIAAFTAAEILTALQSRPKASR